MNSIINIILTFFLFIGFEKIWFFFAGSFFKNQIGPMMNMNGDEIDVRIPAAILVYLLMSIGLYYFVFVIKTPISLFESFYRGAFLGFTVFGVYDLTNRAILKVYPWEMVMLDMMWGTIMFSLISSILFYIHSFKIY